MCSVLLLIVTASCGESTPRPATVATPAGECHYEGRLLITSYCDSELEPQLYDCVRCPGVHGCIASALSAYCVNGDGCEDTRCAPTEKARRDDTLLVH